jgi:hypothetical protein
MFRFEKSPTYPAIAAAAVLGTSALLGGCSKAERTEMCISIPLYGYNGTARKGITQGVLDYTPVTNLDSGTGVGRALKSEVGSGGALEELYNKYQARDIPRHIADLPGAYDQIGIKITYNKQEPNDGPVIAHFPEGTRPFYSPADAEQANPLGTKAVLYDCKTAQVITYLNPKTR